MPCFQTVRLLDSFIRVQLTECRNRSASCCHHPASPWLEKKKKQTVRKKQKSKTELSVDCAVCVVCERNNLRRIVFVGELTVILLDPNHFLVPDLHTARLEDFEFECEHGVGR